MNELSNKYLQFLLTTLQKSTLNIYAFTYNKYIMLKDDKTQHFKFLFFPKLFKSSVGLHFKI